VMDEVSYALDEGKLVVPVLIRSCNIPLRLRRVQYIDFTADYDTGFAQLLRALGIEQPAQPVEPAAAREPVVQDSTVPLEAKPAELHVHEEQAAQEIEEPAPPEASEPIPDEPDHPKPTCPETEKVEEPLLPEVSEPIPDELDHPKSKDLKTEKAWSKSQKTMMLAACVVTLIVIISIVVLLIKLQPETYSLTANAINGSIMKDPNQEYYYVNDTVTLTAMPNENTFTFNGWSGDVSDSKDLNTTLKLVMDADKSVTASFALKTYSLNATARTGGTVRKSPDKPSYKDGDEVTLQAVPKTGYRFDKWSGDLSGSTNPATLPMDANKSVTAKFVKDVTVELTARFDWTGNDEWATRGLDLDTGKVEASDWKGAPIKFERNFELTTWCTAASTEQWRLNFTIPFAKVYEESFDSITKQRIERELSGDGKKNPGDYTYSKDDIFVFRTVEGRCAKLQIVGITDRTNRTNEEHVRTLKVHYVVYDKDI
jgi:hypothetical protein